MKFSIVLATFNRPPGMVENVLYTISLQVVEQGTTAEVIIVDDGGDVEYLQEEIAKYKDTLDVKYIYNHNPGMSANSLSFNIGIKHATGDIVVLSGSDILWCSDVLLKMEKAFNEKGNEKAVVGPYVYGLRERHMQTILGKPRSEWGAFLRECLETAKLAMFSHPDRRDENDNPGFAGLPIYFLSAYRKEVLYEVRGLNEEFCKCETPGGEDVEFNDRLKEYGCHPVWIDTESFHMFHRNTTKGYVGSCGRNKALVRDRVGYKANEGKEWGVVIQRN